VIERIGDYEVRQEIGSGGQATVYRGRAPDGSEVAIKLVVAISDRQLKRFEREAEALARLRHPHLVAVRDVGTHRGTPYLVLDYVRGESLEDRLTRRGPLPPRRAAALTRDLADALNHAHSESLLHRDVKPDNVLLDASEAAYLTDFGLVKDLDPDGSKSRLSRTGTFLGTPGYAAPEQAGGAASSLGPATDVYGLGATLYAMLTGRPPHEGESLLEVAHKTLEEPPVPPSRLSAGIDPELERICLRCLAKAPSERFPSAGALVHALEVFLAREPAAPRRASRATILATTALIGGGSALAAWVLTTSVVAPAATARVEPEPPPPTSPASPPSPRVVTTDAPPPAPDPQATLHAYARLCEDAQGYLRAGDHAAAEARAGEAIALETGLLDAHRVRASARFMQGDTAGAFADLEAARRADPNDPLTWNALATVHELTGSRSEALAALDRTLELDPDLPEALELRGRLRVAELRFRDALPDLSRALELRPGHLEARAARAEARFQLDDEEGAIEDADLVLQTDPGHAYAARTRGLAYLSLGQAELAVADLTLAIEGGRASASTYGNRASARSLLGDKRGALEDYERALELETGDNPNLVYNHALALQHLERHAEAIEAFSQAIELDPDLPMPWFGRGASRSRSGDTDGALEDYDQAVRVDPACAKAYLNRGAIKSDRGDREGALADYTAALEAKPDFKEAWFNRGILRNHMLDHRGAIEDHSQVIAIDPSYARAWVSRGVAKHRAGDLEGAIADYEHGIELLAGQPSKVAEARRWKEIAQRELAQQGE
jgi:tetratricopeptide (TPR) repeat protein